MKNIKDKIIIDDEVFHLQLITKDYVYYINVNDYDDNCNTIMYDKKMNFISDNYFANSNMIEELNNNCKIEFIGKELQYSINNGLLDN